MHHLIHGDSDGHHWYAAFIILCFLVAQFKDLLQAHTIVYFKYLSVYYRHLPLVCLTKILTHYAQYIGYKKKYITINGHHWSPASSDEYDLYFYAPEGTSGGILKSHRPSVCPSVRLSVRPSVRPSVTNRVSAISHKLLKQI